MHQLLSDSQQQREAREGGRTRFSRVSASNPCAHFLVVYQPLQQTPDYAPALDKSSLLPLLLRLRGSAHFPLNFPCVIGNKSSKVQGSGRIKAGNVAPADVLHDT